MKKKKKLNLSQIANVATIVGLIVSILSVIISGYFAYKSYYLSVKQSENETAINTLTEIAKGNKEIVDGNKIQIDKLVSIVVKLDSQNNRLKSIIELNSEQLRNSNKQILISQNESENKYQEDIVKLQEFRELLFQMTPNSIPNTATTGSLYDLISRELLNVLKNPIVTKNNWLTEICVSTKNLSVQMKIYFDYVNFNPQTGICQGKKLARTDANKCNFDVFNAQYKKLINSLDYVIKVKRKQQYKMYLKNSGKKNDKTLEKLIEEIKSFGINQKVN